VGCAICITGLLLCAGAALLKQGADQIGLTETLSPWLAALKQRLRG
jgi:hypothetical protein